MTKTIQTLIITALLSTISIGSGGNNGVAHAFVPQQHRPHSSSFIHPTNRRSTPLVSTGQDQSGHAAVGLQYQRVAFEPEALNRAPFENESAPTLVAEQPPSTRSHVMDTAPSTTSPSTPTSTSIGPWDTSVEEGLDLVFTDFWNWHLDFLQSNLTNVRAKPAQSRDGDIDFALLDEPDARMVNLCFESDEYRKIRMSHYDGGRGIQVLQALWYPDPKYNLPILGIEMARFGGGARHMMASDFQPIHAEEDDHAVTFRHRIEAIREDYPELQGEMSGKWYDHTHFNKDSMLFSRFEDGALIHQDVMPAVKRYAQEHIDMLREVTPDLSEQGQRKVMEQQTAFDKYFAERDQAIHMFRAKRGNEWAEAYVYDFLFELCR